MVVADVDVVVVGAGLSGCATAIGAARAGLTVLLVDQSPLSAPDNPSPAEVLTPRSVRELARLDLPGLQPRLRGVQVVGPGVRVQVPWPATPNLPDLGLVRPGPVLRAELLASAREAGVTVAPNVHVRGPVSAAGRVSGVAFDGPDGPGQYRARAVVAAFGVADRVSRADGQNTRLRDAPRTVRRTVRARFASPRSDEDWLEVWPRLWVGDPGRSAPLPGHGWIAAADDGTCTVGVLTSMRSNGAAAELLRQWTAALPAEWGFGVEQRLGEVRHRLLPTASARIRLYAPGWIAVGKAAGLVSPVTGSGVAAGLLSSRVAADTLASALRERDVDSVLSGYPDALARTLRQPVLGSDIAHLLLGRQSVRRFAVRHGLAIPGVREFGVRLATNSLS